MDWSVFVLPATVAAFAVGALLVLTPRLVQPRRERRVEMRCSVCQRPLAARVEELKPLGPQETGFVVRVQPSAYGRVLAELHCPGCESSHIFAIDKVQPEYIASNPVNATSRKNSCAQCAAPLRKPAWPKGAYDGRLAEAKPLEDRHGLVCPRCGAVVCVQCSREASQGRTAPGTFRCLRCFRGPVETVYHF